MSVRRQIVHGDNFINAYSRQVSYKSPLYNHVKYFDFDGVNDYFAISNNTYKNHVLNGNDFTVSVLVRLDSSGNSFFTSMWDSVASEKVFILGSNSTNNVLLLVSNDGFTNMEIRTNETLSLNTWYLITARYKPSDGSVDIFINDTKATYSLNTITSGIHNTHTPQPIVGGNNSNIGLINGDISFMVAFDEYATDQFISDFYNTNKIIDPACLPNVLHILDSNKVYEVGTQYRHDYNSDFSLSFNNDLTLLQTL